MSPLKGQYLFVRPAEERDEASLRALYEGDGTRPPEPLVANLALVGKLAGTVVGHIAATPVPTGLRITHLYVSREFRRKRIGRGLLRRLEELAGRMQCSTLTADSDSACGPFLAREGFLPSAIGLEKPISVPLERPAEDP